MTQAGHSFLHGGNAAYLDGLYEDYLEDPESVAEHWRGYFATLGREHQPLHSRIRSALRARAARSPADRLPATAAMAQVESSMQVHVLQLINSYRYLGYRQANLDPLEQTARPSVPELELEYHGLGSTEMTTEFNTGSLFGLPDCASLREIINALSTTYCGTIGSEYMHLTDTVQKRWIQKYLESVQGNPPVSAEVKRRILERIVAGTELERYLHHRFVGQKRFSLEGGLALIPLLDNLIQRCGEHGIKELIVGMAHRGRLNVLVNVFGKDSRDLLEEFEGVTRPGFGSGDVKYHKGFSFDLKTRNGTVHAVLAFNPSHLEVINPVVEGSVRARQERRRDRKRNSVLPLLIHGDAAFAGQGVVMETLNLSQTRGYTTGGTVHVVVNNQIGFTTSDPLDSRSTLFCTDVAKMVQAPIFHVNGDDPEAVVFVTNMALDYRMRFNKDVVVDMVCYRRHGHSEADEPSVTQPLMYRHIRRHPGLIDIYREQLEKEGVIGSGEVEAMAKDYIAKVQSGDPVCGPIDYAADHSLAVDYSAFRGKHWTEPADTCISLERARDLTRKFTQVPGNHDLHPRVVKLLRERASMGEGQVPMDWGFAETLAYASLLEDGYSIRLSGQDSVRGTFAHRHAGIHDQKTGEVIIPLQHLFEDQPQFLPINSLLSEEAVLGFEVGYSTAEPQSLVIWEAQFGDFANNAQVIIDQFISSSEAKWQRYCGLVMFLPHGYDGQGPEHSSARLERYLQLCAEENIQVCVPSTPSQMFHLLRRQMLRPYRKPLIVMTPKSLLRHKTSASPLEAVANAGFQPVIDEVVALDPNAVSRLVVCSGKVYYDIMEKRRDEHLENVAIIRIEQQYPFPADELNRVLARYPNALDIVWAQEEPRNQGAWYYMQSLRHLKGCIGPHHRLSYAGRRYYAAPAVGYLHKHRRQQRALVLQALALDEVSADATERSAVAN
ncbi:MAG: 2-oxoglutarate dehydrogenase E1 component [Gammaproteobacteria bacterium]|jgi:2-oxoglutarate dehydrogenase E1 component|nr:2-oxoglutarate dehydrogenase E1 component [Gammaproteobacteria bacterium]